MNDFISKRFSKSKASGYTGIAKPRIYYRHWKRTANYDVDIEKRISNIVNESPSYGTR